MSFRFNFLDMDMEEQKYRKLVLMDDTYTVNNLCLIHILDTSTDDLKFLKLGIVLTN